MLNFPSSVEEYGQWLTIRVSWTSPHLAPTYSLRFFDGSRHIRIGSGPLGGSPESWAALLRRSGTRSRPRHGQAELTQIDEVLLQELLESDATAGLAGDLIAAVSAFHRQGSFEQPLPLFVSSNFTLSVEAFAWIVYGVAASTPDLLGKLVIVVTPVGRGTMVQATPHVYLPLKVACAKRIAPPLVSSAWYLAHPTINAFALQIESSPESLPNAPDADVTVGDAGDVDERILARWLRSDETNGKLRILVNAPPVLELASRHVRGVATISVKQGFADAVDVVRDVLEEIIHDKPLHLAVAFACRHAGALPGNASVIDRIRAWLNGPRLYADPGVNEWFRLSKTLPYVSKVAGRPFALSQGAQLTEFIDRLGHRTSPSIAEKFQASVSGLDQASSQLRSAFGTNIEFSRESTGLLSIATVLAAHDALERSESENLGPMLAMLREDHVADALEHSQERRVDAKMFVLPAHGVPKAVDPTLALEPESLVRLSVHIGQRGKDSLIVGEPPALDPLLPPLENELQHRLDFVVYPKDFSLVSEKSMQTAELPRFGGTRTISWDLRVPPLGIFKGNAAPQAELRFSVYFKNQLLQSFRLTAALSSATYTEKETGVKIVCDFSQTRRFGELDRLGDRVMNIALNDSANGTHTLMVKEGDKDPVTINWAETQLVAHTKTLRKTLEEAMFNGKQTRFAFDKDTLEVSPGAGGGDNFDAVVRNMASAGNALNTQLILMHANAAEAKAMFRAVLEQKDKTVQVVLLSADYALPWASLYDYDIPAAAPGTLLPVCRGVDGTGAGPCGCDPRSSKGICLRGFWGFRHIIEQLAPAPPPDRDIPGLIATKRISPTLGMLRTISDQFVDVLPKILPTPPAFTRVDYPDSARSLFEIIEEQGDRPSIVLYVGHQRGGGEPPSDPMLISSKDFPMLRLADISRKVRDGAPWEEPRSLVLLMGCGTATTRVDTGFSLAAALLQLGAIGVVGTECDVATGIASRVARDLVTALASNKTMGVAFKETIWNLAQQGCPVGLAFSYVGPVDAGLP